VEITITLALPEVSAAVVLALAARRGLVQHRPARYRVHARTASQEQGRRLPPLMKKKRGPLRLKILAWREAAPGTNEVPATLPADWLPAAA
jgi:hypothetical protein